MNAISFSAQKKISSENYVRKREMQQKKKKTSSQKCKVEKIRSKKEMRKKHKNYKQNEKSEC